MNKNTLCYFALLSERPDAMLPDPMLPVGLVCSLVFMVQWQGLIQFDLYMESIIKK